MTLIKATATHAGRWWIGEFTIDGREYGTQARRLDQLEAMIKDATSLMTNEEPDTFTVAITPVGIPFSIVSEYHTAAEASRTAESRLSAASRAAVHTLTEAGLSMRDVGTLMGLSVQRVSQLARS
ncbi:hypothetical protein [Trueperella pyogenes]|uniref:hypothetical protein n=1 Tax=Trueperella pyogenes TaxID=1661 RepID=UPI0032447106